MQKSEFNTPILFLVFNRPQTTKKVFRAIAKIRPKYLFVAADGPRANISGEFETCAEVRKITEKIDWDCKVRRLYRKKNLGCGVAVSDAIDWFFKTVDKGIILEDDCLPDKSFFTFCENMLKRYKPDSRIMHVSGDNFLGAKFNDRNHYIFSAYPHVWGWATWRRAWKKYDFTMKKWKASGFFDKFKFVRGDFINKLYWASLFDGVATKGIDTWDYQWIYANMVFGGLSITPGVNLVTNIGFGKESSHTKLKNKLSSIKRHSISRSVKPKFDVGVFDGLEKKKVFNIYSFKTFVLFVYYSIIRTLSINPFTYERN